MKILAGAMGGELSLKLPFTLAHAPRADGECEKPTVTPKEPKEEQEVRGIAKVEVHDPRPAKCSFLIKKNGPDQDDDDAIVPCGQEEVT